MPAKSSKQKVWHITDFSSLFELGDDLRKKRSGPLRFTKSIVTLSSFSADSETRHFERLCRLKSHPRRHLLRSIFEDLKNWSATKEFSLRGFLVEASGKPASIEYIASQLALSVEDLKQALLALHKIGLIERVTLDDQSKKGNRTSGKKGGKKTTKKAGKKSSTKNRRNAQSAAKQTNEAAIKGFPESAGMKRNETESSCPPLREDKNKSKSKSKSKGKWVLTNPKENDNRQGEEQSARMIRESEAKAQGDSQKQAETNTQDQSQTSQTTTDSPERIAPTTTPPKPMPISPPIADAGGCKPRVISFTPRQSLSNNRSVSTAERLANCVTMRGHSREAMEAAARYLDRVGYRPPDNGDMARELGCFSKAFDNLLGEGFNVDAMAWFDNQMLKRCDIVRRRPARNRQQYLLKVFQNLSHDLRKKFGRTAPPRAAPVTEAG